MKYAAGEGGKWIDVVSKGKGRGGGGAQPVVRGGGYGLQPLPTTRGPPRPTLSQARDMSIADLKINLRRFDLPTTGSKEELAAHLAGGHG